MARTEENAFWNVQTISRAVAGGGYGKRGGRVGNFFFFWLHNFVVAQLGNLESRRPFFGRVQRSTNILSTGSRQIVYLSMGLVCRPGAQKWNSLAKPQTRWKSTYLGGANAPDPPPPFNLRCSPK